MTPEAPETNPLLRRQLLGRPVAYPGKGPAKIVGWSGHDMPWPLVRLETDPVYFGALLMDDRAEFTAAIATLKAEQRAKRDADKARGRR